MDKKVLQDIRAYFLEDIENERGCFLLKNGEIIPFTNVSDYPRARIEIGHQDWSTMVDLLLEDKLQAWVHSHPHYPAIPSSTDLTYHRFPCDMLIYSHIDDCFTVWTVPEIQALRKRLIITTEKYEQVKIKV